jgi:hypothetical protein
MLATAATAGRAARGTARGLQRHWTTRLMYVAEEAITPTTKTPQKSQSRYSVRRTQNAATSPSTESSQSHQLPASTSGRFSETYAMSNRSGASVWTPYRSFALAVQAAVRFSQAWLRFGKSQPP